VSRCSKIIKDYGMLLAESEHLRVNLAEDLTFVTELFIHGEWRKGTTNTSAIYNLVPNAASKGELRGESDGYSWVAELIPQAGGIGIEVTLTVSHNLQLNPSFLLWLGILDNLDDRQAHTWRQTVLRAPTTNQQGLGGNDLPASYFYDPTTHIETILYTPPDKFAWSPHRFYEFTLREVTEYRPVPRYGLGLLPNTPDSLFTFPQGTHKLAWWFTQHYREEIPTCWEAQTTLIEAITPLLDTVPTLYDSAPNWTLMSEHTVEDLHHPACWININGIEGLRAYVQGSSCVGRDEAQGFELITQLDVLHPLLLWRRATGNTKADSMIERLLKTLAYFDRPVEKFVANGFPLRDTFMDTWYFFENALIKLPWVAYLTNDSELKAMFFRAMEGARQLILQTENLTPLFADAKDWQLRHSVLNAGVGGLFAAGCALAVQMGEPSYEADARRILRTLHILPSHMLTHEPQQLAFTAAAANYFGEPFSHDFVNLSLRMGYWAKDPSVPFYDPRGMFQACASLCYPAYKENIETVMPWSELLSSGTSHLPVKLMAAWINLQRCHNYAFFDPWLPEDKRHGPCSYIPYENIATHEFEHTATFDKELYGAGEVFWSALLFDTFGRVNYPDVLCLSLDVPCLHLSQKQLQARFLLYNPATDERRVTLVTSRDELSLTLPPESVEFIEREV
jgi:hypothetical protein